MKRLIRILTLLTIASQAWGCGLFPRSRFDEARESLPAIRAYALQHLPGLTDEERQIINTRAPKMAQANYVEYYFRWEDAAGERIAEVAASPPPCVPHGARGRLGLAARPGAAKEQEP